MKKFEFDITLQAKTEAEAESKMNALVALAQSLSVKELEKLAWIVQNDPVKTAMAKKALGV